MGSIFCHAEVAFGEDDYLVARDGVFLEGFADYSFRDAVGVDVCGVPGVNAYVVSVLEEWESCFFVENPLEISCQSLILK